MQVARVFSDYAAKTNGKHVYVTYDVLELETHAARTTISRAVKDLVARGYLVPDGVQANGKRAYYNLVIHNQSTGATGQDSDQSTGATATSSAAIPQAVASLDCERQERQGTSSSAPVSPLARGFLRDLGATDEEASWIEAKIRQRGARNVAAVLRAEQQQGTMQALLSEARRATYKRPEWCGRCDEATRLVDTPEGRAARCSSCHPGHLRAVS